MSTESNERRTRNAAGRFQIASLVLVVSLAAGTAGAQETEPRNTMHRVFEALSQLLPAALDEDRWTQPEQVEAIQEWLDVLAVGARDLAGHARTRDPGFRYLSYSLAANVEEIRFRYEAGRTDQARYFLMESTKNCVACHSSLPRAREFPMAEKLTSQLELDRLSPHEQAQIAVVTRRFEDALDIWEKLFRDENVTPGSLDLGGYLLDYLTIAIRVVGDIERPKPVLERLEKRSGVSRELASRLRAWRRDLSTYGPEVKGEVSLAHAERLIGSTKLDARSVPGRERMVRDLVATTILRRYIDGVGVTDEQLAKAFYLLGFVERRSVGSFWVPQAEFHFEAAMRLHPDGPLAKDAFRLFEESIQIGYGGSAGVQLPVDVQTKLVDLRNLVGIVEGADL